MEFLKFFNKKTQPINEMNTEILETYKEIIDNELKKRKIAENKKRLKQAEINSLYVKKRAEEIIKQCEPYYNKKKISSNEDIRNYEQYINIGLKGKNPKQKINFLNKELKEIEHFFQTEIIKKKIRELENEKEKKNF